MARNRSFDFSDDDFIAAPQGSHLTSAEVSESGSAAGLQGMQDMQGPNDELIGDAATGQHSGKHAATQKAAQQAQTATQTRSTTGQQQDTPTSMRDKRSNQPR